jgi:hypothetical protein
LETTQAINILKGLLCSRKVIIKISILSVLEMGKGGCQVFGLNCPPEEWSYLAIVVEKNMIRVFRNGSLIVSADASDSIRNSKMPVQVGS